MTTVCWWHHRFVETPSHGNSPVDFVHLILYSILQTPSEIHITNAKIKDHKVVVLTIFQWSESRNVLEQIYLWSINKIPVEFECCQNLYAAWPASAGGGPEIFIKHPSSDNEATLHDNGHSFKRPRCPRANRDLARHDICLSHSVTLVWMLRRHSRLHSVN